MSVVMQDDMGQVESQKHKPGFWLVAVTVLWERFAYYGLTSLMFLYFIAPLAKGGMGLDSKSASMLYGTFAALVYLAAPFGGWACDKFLGQQKSILAGALFIAAGNFALYAANSTFMIYVALFGLIVGNGFFKSACSNLVGDLYTSSSMKDKAYSYFYTFINIGAFIAPLLTGIFATKMFAQLGTDGEILVYGYKMAFLACGIGMVIGGVIFLVMAPKMLGQVGKQPLGNKKSTANPDADKPLDKREKSRCVAMIIITVFVTLFWTAYYQTSTSLTEFADTSINRMIGNFEVPTNWFVSLNAILCVILGPVMGAIWVKLSKREKGDLNVPTKMGLGLLFSSVAFFIMVAAVSLLGSDPQAKASMMWIVLFYIFNTVGEMCLSPIGLSMFNKLSPAKYAGLFMGVWYLSSCFSNWLSGYIASFTSSLGYMSLFMGIGVVVGVLGIIMLVLNKKLQAMMD